MLLSPQCETQDNLSIFLSIIFTLRTFVDNDWNPFRTIAIIVALIWWMEPSDLSLKVNIDAITIESRNQTLWNRRFLGALLSPSKTRLCLNSKNNPKYITMIRYYVLLRTNNQDKSFQKPNPKKQIWWIIPYLFIHSRVLKLNSKHSRHFILYQSNMVWEWINNETIHREFQMPYNLLKALPSLLNGLHVQSIRLTANRPSNSSPVEHSFWSALATVGKFIDISQGQRCVTWTTRERLLRFWTAEPPIQPTLNEVLKAKLMCNQRRVPFDLCIWAESSIQLASFYRWFKHKLYLQLRSEFLKW